MNGKNENEGEMKTGDDSKGVTDQIDLEDEVLKCLPFVLLRIVIEYTDKWRYQSFLDYIWNYQLRPFITHGNEHSRYFRVARPFLQTIDFQNFDLYATLRREKDLNERVIWSVARTLSSEEILPSVTLLRRSDLDLKIHRRFTTKEIEFSNVFKRECKVYSGPFQSTGIACDCSTEEFAVLCSSPVIFDIMCEELKERFYKMLENIVIKSKEC